MLYVGSRKFFFFDNILVHIHYLLGIWGNQDLCAFMKRYHGPLLRFVDLENLCLDLIHGCNLGETPLSFVLSSSRFNGSLYKACSLGIFLSKL